MPISQPSPSSRFFSDLARAQQDILRRHNNQGISAEVAQRAMNDLQNAQIDALRGQYMAVDSFGALRPSRTQRQQYYDLSSTSAFIGTANVRDDPEETTGDNIEQARPYRPRSGSYDRDYLEFVVQRELRHFEELLSGTPVWEFRIHKREDTIYLSSVSYGFGYIVAVIDDEKVEYSDHRSRHLVPMLRRYAEQQGLELVERGEIEHMSLPDGTVELMLWTQRNRQVDDSDLISHTEFAMPSGHDEDDFNHRAAFRRLTNIVPF